MLIKPKESAIVIIVIIVTAITAAIIVIADVKTINFAQFSITKAIRYSKLVFVHCTLVNSAIVVIQLVVKLRSHHVLPADFAEVGSILRSLTGSLEAGLLVVQVVTEHD